jgi:hypothetical protein
MPARDVDAPLTEGDLRVLRALRAGPSGLGVLSLVLGERPNVVASRMVRLAGASSCRSTDRDGH